MKFQNGNESIQYVHDVVSGQPTLCLLHCFGSNHRFWDPQIPYLSAYSLLRPDARGHGSSSRPAGPFSIAQMAGDVISLLDHLGIDQCHLTGASMGGMVAQHLAIHHSDRVASLMLITTTFEYPDEQRERWRELALSVQRDGTDSVQETLMARWFSSQSREENRPGYQFMSDAFAQFHPDSFAWSAEAVRLVDFGAQLSQIAQPTLVVASEHDPGVTPARSQQLADTIPDANLVWTPHAHHLASLEHPEFVGRAMADFLATCVSK